MLLMESSVVSQIYAAVYTLPGPAGPLLSSQYVRGMKGRGRMTGEMVMMAPCSSPRIGVDPESLLATLVVKELGIDLLLTNSIDSI